MKPEKLQDAIGMVSDDLITETGSEVKHKKKKSKLWIAACAACLALAIIAGVIFMPEFDVITDTPDGGKTKNSINLNAYAISESAYPETVAYPEFDENMSDYDEYSAALDKWQTSRDSLTKGYDRSMNIDSFFKASFKEMLSGSDGENKVYSPLNIYFALGMLTELTDGQSRQQILDTLGVKTIDTLRTTANALWRANYYDDGQVKSILASSLWLNEDISFKPEALQKITDTYYASSYKGKMGSADFNSAFQSWLNNQTGNLLSDQISNIEMQEETLLALASTIYFKAGWTDKFQPVSTDRDVFHADSGDIECDFMHQSRTGSCFYGKNFTAVKLHLSGSGNMCFILPDEGVSLDEVIANDETTEMIIQGDLWQDRESALINMSVPKFDVSAQTDLSKILKNLGVTDAFDPNKSDFSPMTDLSEVYVSSALHGARVMIDEEGCTGAAYTTLLVNGTSMPLEKIDFTLDRPFIFVVTSATSDPLFAGVVNRP